jgi:hypothetical protein
LVEEKQSDLRELQTRIETTLGAQPTYEDDEMTRDTFTQLDDQESHHEGEDLIEGTEGVMPTDDDETTMDAWEESTTELVGSQMFVAGQLSADLALSDSDSDNENSSQRPRLDEDLDAL